MHQFAQVAIAGSLSAVDDLLRHADDKPSIGLILRKTKNRIIADALRNSATPMGISEFRHLEELPDRLRGTLPTIEEIPAEWGSRDLINPFSWFPVS